MCALSISYHHLWIKYIVYYGTGFFKFIFCYHTIKVLYISHYINSCKLQWFGPSTLIFVIASDFIHINLQLLCWDKTFDSKDKPKITSNLILRRKHFIFELEHCNNFEITNGNYIGFIYNVTHQTRRNSI